MDPPFRFITVDTILTLLFSITPSFSTENKMLFKNAYGISIKLVKDLCKLEGLFIILFVIFKEQCEFFNYHTTNRAKVHKQILSDTILLCGIMDDPKLKSTDLLHFPLGQKETAKSYIRIFLAIKEGYQSHILGSHNKESNQIVLLEEEKEKAIGSLYVLSETQKLIPCNQEIKKERLNRYY